MTNREAEAFCNEHAPPPDESDWRIEVDQSVPMRCACCERKAEWFIVFGVRQR